MLNSTINEIENTDNGIKLSHLSKTYQTATGPVPALIDVNLTVQPGEIFGIIGKSGAGKSSLLRCVNLLEHPSAGTVEVAGQMLTSLSSKELLRARQSIGMIFQHFNLLDSATVYSNIALPLRLAGYSKAQIDAKLMPLLELTQLSDKQNTYPTQLSGGQKQRVAIARALANQPKVLLCDEATSSLDPATTLSILKLLGDINRQFNLTILLITHEMEVIKTICDQVAVLDQGKIVEQAAVTDFFVRPQTEVGTILVKDALKHELPELLQERISQIPTTDANPVIQIFFQGQLAQQPFISQIAQQFGLRLNILQANIETLRHQTIGVMVLEVLAEHSRLPEAIAYLKEQGVIVESLGYVT